MIRDEQELRKRAESMLPKGVPADAISSVECDPYNGGDSMYKPSYWVNLKPGWRCLATDSHVIHEDTLSDLKTAIKSIER